MHTHIIKSGFRPNTNISIKLLILYLKLLGHTRSLREAWEFVTKMPKLPMNFFSLVVQIKKYFFFFNLN
ncbi:hypothetical protein CFOL_v3_30907 [Cephalotus follicularis]|uniref:Uncharacterized protein n=1 Tax=Cephalotus follicularis TaxID=3775 RepID=A0A1Q3D4Z3_CEPFO|nr:hypothetical protein CFOL_v3_30907 [Cephalotus follicularis]